MFKANETLYSSTFMLICSLGQDGNRQDVQNDSELLNLLALKRIVNNQKKRVGNMYKSSRKP